VVLAFKAVRQYRVWFSLRIVLLFVRQLLKNAKKFYFFFVFFF